MAAAGIVLPVLIHLWNKREGKILKIGSVQLLAETARQQARSLRIKDILLLLLRCGIIILLAVLLTKPVWQKQLNPKDKKGWVVLDTQSREAYKNNKRLIDSLLLAGFESHHFKMGFPVVNPEDTLQEILPVDTIPYWALLKALNEQVPDDLPVYLFNNNRLTNFSGDRPITAMNLHLSCYTDADTTTGNTVAARLLATDSIGEIVSKSTAAYTAYHQQNKSAQQTKLSIQNATDSNSHSIAADTSVLQIGIFADAFGTDANYLQAALNAVRQFGQYRMQIETITDPGKSAANYNWVFWLSPKPVPLSLKYSNLFLYEKGKEKPMYSWLEYPMGDVHSAEKIGVTKGITKEGKATGETVWGNGFGEPVLSLEKGEKMVYHFYSRFDPSWNDLVWSERFPQLLFDLILDNKQEKNPNDNRTIEANQIQPTVVRATDLPAKAKFLKTSDLSKFIWIMAFLLFTLERIISTTYKRTAHAG